MKHLLLTAAISAFTLCSMAQAPLISRNMAASDSQTQLSRDFKAENNARQTAGKRMMMKNVMKAPAPGVSTDIITETPEGTQSVYQKFGFYCGYNWLFAFIRAE